MSRKRTLSTRDRERIARAEVHQDADQQLANDLVYAREAGHNFMQLLQRCAQHRQLAAVQRVLHELSETAARLPPPFIPNEWERGVDGPW